ncbi:MAG: histidine phosphatase family protein [Acidimicrobiales bacterium]
MELLLIRHARPERIEVAEGPVDPDLDRTGRRQAEALASWLADERHLDALYTSPLARARQTAAPLARAQGLEPVVEDEVAEWDRDAHAYIPIEELRATNHPWWRAMATGDWAALGVDPVAFVARVVAALDGVAARHPSAKVAVVCHGGVINAYLGAVLGIERVLWFDPGYTSVSRVFVSREGVRSVGTVNEIAHLRAVDAAPAS